MIFYNFLLFYRVVRVALLIGAATFFPASNVLVTVGFVLAERNLYLPCAGYSLLASYAFLRKGNWKVFAFTVTMFYLRSVQRSMQWTNDGLLFQSGLQVSVQCIDNVSVEMKNYVQQPFCRFRFVQVMPKSTIIWVRIMAKLAIEKRRLQLIKQR